MRRLCLLLLLALGLPDTATTQTCTGLCLQQVSCTGGGTTSISGTVYAPNGVDPLPNVLVFIPNAAPAPMTAGVQCLVPGATPSGSPLVGTTTAADGTFTINDIPVGANIPLVIQSGKWRRQVVIPSTVACTNTVVTADLTHFPQNQSQGDIPQFAIATGRVDSVECVLRKVGIADSEFTDPTGTGRIHLFEGQGTMGGNQSTSAGGAVIDSSTPSQSTLMGSSSLLNKYDVIMLPCQGTDNGQGIDATQNANFLQYVNAGGRVFANHWSYIWLANNASLAPVATWSGATGSEASTASATVNTSFAGGATLAAWLQLVGASTIAGEVSLNNVFNTITSVGSASQTYLNLNTTGSPAVQFTFNTPIGVTNQCGRVLFNDYHVESPTSQTARLTFPTECAAPTTTLSPQDKLLEYSLFDLTSNGGSPTLTPSTIDFGTEAVGFTTASKTFSWTNNSKFATGITSATVTGDFVVTGQTCQNVAPGASCTISVAFKPTVVGPANGTLTVVAPAGTLMSTVTGTGVAAVTSSTTSLAFPNTDVGASVTESFTLTNNAPGAISTTGLTVSGDYSLAGGCGSSLAAGGTCMVNVTFTPTTTGSRTGAVTLAGVSVALTGTGVDFTVAIPQSSGSVVAGNSLSVATTVLPVSGFSSNVTMTCTTNAPASTCAPSVTSFVPSTTAHAGVVITTTSKYTVVGYRGFGL